MSNLSTEWPTDDIWVRRSFELSQDYAGEDVWLEYSHDDNFELYINGLPVIETGYVWKNNVLYELPGEVKATLKPGKNIIAAHCHNTTGGGYVDFGLFLKEMETSFDTPALQKTVQVMPTQTYYTFACGAVELDLIFTAPLLLDQLDLLSTPVNYISYQVRAVDGKPHEVQIYLDASSRWAMNMPGQKMESDIHQDVAQGEVAYAKTGTTDQPILGKKGDDLRIDWGYFYLAAGKTPQLELRIGNHTSVKKQFLEHGTLASAEPPQSFLKPDDEPVLALSRDLGTVNGSEAGFFLIGYDDLYSIQYFKDNRMGYWKHDGKVSMAKALEKAQKDYVSVMKRCRDFDARMMDDATKAGNKEYAALCALAYRQSIAAHKLVTDKEGNLLFLSKENFSNGSIGTVDLSYPSAPLFLIYNPELLKGMLNPIFYFSESGQWNKPYAAHDVGTYPLANGQTYGGDMPVEESGNMLILATAIALREGNANYAEKHWAVLTTWANFLLKEGLDPENQLCTDDFAGHFAHNANLSIKAIMGIAGYSKLAEMLGEKETARQYLAAAKEMASKWLTMAYDGDHYRLTFDQPGTWSQKYNLIWDKLFGLHIFAPEIAGKEIAYYLTKQNAYGLPLDSRKTYTKSDWILWSACLTDDSEAFGQLIAPVYTYANTTTTRMPLSDWHETTNGHSIGFRARSVVGGYFMKLLEVKMKK
jgi:hypothetical protein